MGFSDLKAICSICGKEVGLDRYKLIKDKSWICSKCLRKAEGDKVVNFLTHTAKDVREMIAEKRIKDEIGDNDFLNDQLNTAEEMYKFCIDRKIRRYWIEKRSLKHFKIIEENLLEGENVEMAFLGLYDYSFSNKKNKKFAYAITDRSILMGRKNMIFGKKFDEICLSSINDITYKTGIVIDIITLHTKDRKFTLGTDKKTAKIIDYKIKRAAELGTGNKSHDELNNNMINNDKLKHNYDSYSNGNINTDMSNDVSDDISNNINYNNSNNSNNSSDISDNSSNSSNCSSNDNVNYSDSSNYSSDKENYNNSGDSSNCSSDNGNYGDSNNNNNSYNNGSDNSDSSNCSRDNGNYNNSNNNSYSSISNSSNDNSNYNSRSINKNDAAHNNSSKSYDKNYSYENNKDENAASEDTYNNDDTMCVIDDIKKFKELLDMDILTEKEFQLKKKELLGL